MIRVWGSFILATALSYWTVGFLGLRVFRYVLRWPFHDTDQATTTAVLIDTPDLAGGLVRRSPAVRGRGRVRHKQNRKPATLLVTRLAPASLQPWRQWIRCLSFMPCATSSMPL